jgi:DNA-binding transcriptional ArsR family regulator
MKSITKINPEELNKAANMLKAIAHPLRIAIIELLIDEEELTVTQIHELLSVEQSTTSHHLGILRDKGVLASKREGKHTHYYLKYKKLKTVINCIQDCCG